jgi:hypothetical protein
MSLPAITTSTSTEGEIETIQKWIAFSAEPEVS